LDGCVDLASDGGVAFKLKAHAQMCDGVWYFLQIALDGAVEIEVAHHLAKAQASATH
jgi:hypothetical protein